MSNPFVRAADKMSASPFLHVMLVGESGSGKTSWAARSPRPLVLLTEPQGMASIVAANPDAIVVEVTTWRSFASFFANVVKTGMPVVLENGQAAYRIKHRDHTADIQTIVLDGMTDLQRMMLREFCRDIDEAFANVSDMKEDQISPAMWGRTSDFTIFVARELRDLPVNTIFTTLADVVVEEGTGKRTVMPSVRTKAKAQLGQFCSLVGYAEIVASRAGTTARRIWFERPGYPAKPAPGFPVRVDVTTEPGVSTLGSLALAFLPVDKSRIPAGENDRADLVVVPEPPIVTVPAQAPAQVAAPVPASSAKPAETPEPTTETPAPPAVRRERRRPNV